MASGGNQSLSAVTVLIGPADAVPGRFVKLLLDSSAAETVISSRVVKTVLKLAMPTSDFSDVKKIRILGQDLKHVGSIDISFKMPAPDAQQRTMHCKVVDDDETPWDLLSGTSVETFGDLEAYVKAHIEVGRFYFCAYKGQNMLT